MPRFSHTAFIVVARLSATADTPSQAPFEWMACVAQFAMRYKRPVALPIATIQASPDDRAMA
jgi:hypothetical protein